jgi:non-specific serine/threonine protein kinase
MGDVIADRYELIEKIGTGGMGVVYRALDTRTQQSVAVKKLKEDVSTPEMIERFRREGEALRQLNHPNIVRSIDSLELGQDHYLVFEYVPGGDLRKLLSQSRLSTERIMQIGLDLADALTRAHRLNIIHRDLKPGNVLLAEDGTPRLADFGVARLIEKDRMTQSGALLGTISYMAPESLMSGEADTRSDIWSFGTMLYEMLMGDPPFARPSLIETMKAITAEPLLDLETLRPDLPVALVDLIYRMLEKDPQRRIASVRLVGAELEAILHGEVTPGSLPTRPSLQNNDKTVMVVEATTPAPTTTHNLPEQPTAFIGRETELIELLALLDTLSVRLVTILGPGGMGKTRLALETLARSKPSFKDGVCFVSLAPLADPTLIVQTIGEALHLPFSSGEPLKNQLMDYLRDKQLLLDLDNFEHLIEGVGLIADLLQAAPGVKILVTSRERLNIQWETLFVIEGMDFPDWETPGDAAGYSAVRLFMQSARRGDPTFDLTADNVKYLARICRQVKGMPLGIVLAAAWVADLTLAEISAEIERNLDFLESDMRDLPERQRSIRAVFDYSWALLNEEERTTMKRLSVFRGSFTREAAQQIAGSSLRTLNVLVNKSLLLRDSIGRYQAHELLRQYAETRLAAAPDELAAIQQKHGTYYAEFLDQRWKPIRSARQIEVLAEIEREIDNVRAAWAAAIDHTLLSLMAKMSRVLWIFLDLRVRFDEAAASFQAAVDKLRPLPPGEARDLALAESLYSLSYILSEGDDESGRNGRKLAEESITLIQQYDAPELEVRAWIAMVKSSRFSRAPAAAELYRVVQKAETLTDPWYQAFATFILGMALFEAGNYAEAFTVGKKAIALIEPTGDVYYSGVSNGILTAQAAIYIGLVNEARYYSERGLRYFERVGIPSFTANMYGLIAMVSLIAGDISTARRSILSALDHFNKMKLRSVGNIIGATGLIADIMSALGDDTGAVQILAFALSSSAKSLAIQLGGQQKFEALRARMAPDLFADAVERGQAFDIDQMIAYINTSFGIAKADGPSPAEST